MLEILSAINTEMVNLNIPYEFMQWTKEASTTYFVGEYLEGSADSEDGREDATFIITGTTRGSWLDLENFKETIKNNFKKISGKIIAKDGTIIVIFYDNSFPVPTNDETIKRIQINLNIKEWKVSE